MKLHLKTSLCVCLLAMASYEAKAAGPVPVGPPDMPFSAPGATPPSPPPPPPPSPPDISSQGSGSSGPVNDGVAS